MKLGLGLSIVGTGAQRPAIPMTADLSSPPSVAAAALTETMTISSAALTSSVSTGAATVTHVPTVQSVLGSRLYRWLRDYATGTWTDAMGNTNATQGTAANKPTASTLTGVTSQSYPDFDGAASPNNDYLTVGGLSSLPAYSSGDSFLQGGLIRVDTNPDNGGWVLNSSGNTDAVLIHSSGAMAFNGALIGDLIVTGAGWVRWLLHSNGTSGVLKAYMQGDVQTSQPTSSVGSTWKTNTFTIGDVVGSGGRVDGGMGSMFWARSSSAFSAQDIEDMDRVLADFVYRGPYYIASGAAAVGTTSLSVAYPTRIQAGDMLVLCIANKYPNNGPSTPSGWTAPSNNQGSGGAGSAGADSGTVYSTVFYKVADGTETGSLSVTITSGNCAVGRMLLYRKPSSYASWSVAATNGADNSAGTSWSVTGAADPGIAANDVVVVCSASNTDARTHSAEALSATGVTFSTAIERQDSATANGDQCALVVSEHTATSGTSSAAPVFTMTASGSTANQVAGASVFLRLRAA